MRRGFAFTAAVTVSLATAAARPALAGFTATTTTDAVLTPAGSLAGPQPGDTFQTTTSGGFSAFLGDTPADPTITGGDLALYRYTLNGAVATANTITGVVTYTGTYRIFYDANGTQVFAAPDPTVSAGNFTITAAFLPATNDATLTGSLIQTQGPTNPAFRDLSYGGNPVLYTGTYAGTNPGVSGTIQGALRQNAVVPEPATLSLLGLAGLTLARRRRRAGATG